MAASERFTLRSAVYLFLIRQDRILLARRYKTGWQDGKYSVVAGHLDGGETVFQAMIREAREEAGIILDPAQLKVVHVMHRIPIGNDLEYIDFFLTAPEWDGVPEIREPDKCDDLRWFPLDHLPDNIIPSVQAAIDNYRNNTFFADFYYQ